MAHESDRTCIDCLHYLRMTARLLDKSGHASARGHSRSVVVCRACFATNKSDGSLAGQAQDASGEVVAPDK